MGECSGLLLDIGCGNGPYAQWAEEHHPDLVVVGLEQSLSMAEVAGAIRSDGCEMAVRDACVHQAICVAMLHHLPSPRMRLAVVTEIARVLRPGGRASISVWAF
jgi:SAM-dependent methyltransferase